jgi:dTDP-4-amino-4,6-dideoxygalactose transaminase
MSKPDNQVPILDLRAQFARIRDEVRAAIDEVLESQLFILGEAVANFERAIANYLGTPNAIGVASGSDALLLALMALRIGPGDAVIVPPFTFFATASCVSRLGARPLFVDIEAGGYLLSPGAVRRFLEDQCTFGPGGTPIHRGTGHRVRAILPVHLYGEVCPMAELLSLAREFRLAVVEDSAQALGAEAGLPEGPVKAGAAGDFGCFSFFPTKNLGGMGDGGLVVTPDRAAADLIRKLRVHGQAGKYQHELMGLNSRLDALQARVLHVKLKYLDAWCDERGSRASRYRQLFLESGLLGAGVIDLPATGGGRRHVFHQFVIRAERRDELKSYLQERGVQTEIHYPAPLHLQPCFSYLGYRPGDFPNAERACREVLALPMYPELSEEQQRVVVRKIGEFYRV